MLPLLRLDPSEREKVQRIMARTVNNQRPRERKLDLDIMELGETDAPRQAFEEFSGSVLAGRAGTPEDVTGTALYLASEDSDYMTGQVVMIDAGMVLV